MIQKIIVIAIVLAAAAYLAMRIRRSWKKGPVCSCGDPSECPYSNKELKKRVCTVEPARDGR